MGSMREANHIATLDKWAEWGKACAPQRRSRPEWSAVGDLIEAARPHLLEDSRVLRERLERSREQLKFTDPLLCDLGLHRWLAKDREEAYSDWLAWVLKKLGDADAVLRVLGVQNQEFRSLCSDGTYEIEREAFVQEGTADCEGRIDILLHFGTPEKALVGVEVKTGDESYEKQRGYLKSLSERCLHAKGILVAIPPVPSDSCFDFELRRWQDVGVALRQEIARFVRRDSPDSTAAMMCGFLAAIEQNLLEFGTASARRAWRAEPTWLSPQLKDYLRSINTGEGMNSKIPSENLLFLRGAETYIDALVAVAAFEDEVKEICADVYSHPCVRIGYANGTRRQRFRAFRRARSGEAASGRWCQSTCSRRMFFPGVRFLGRK
jgi:hypothetical protein